VIERPGQVSFSGCWRRQAPWTLIYTESNDFAAGQDHRLARHGTHLRPGQIQVTVVLVKTAAIALRRNRHEKRLVFSARRQRDSVSDASRVQPATA